MLKPEVVDRIRELAGRGSAASGSPRSGISRNSVRRYLAGATVGFQERPAARRLDGATLREVHELFGTVAEGTPSSFSRSWLPRESRSSSVPCSAPLRPCARSTRRGPGHGPVRDPAGSTNADRFRREGRDDRRPAREGLPDDRRPGLLAAALCRAFLAQRQDDWLEGLDGAFRHFGGLTEQILCDNASPLVISHDRQTGQVVWNPGFEAFCRDRGLTALACRPRRARTKGKIERGVGYVKHNALAGRSFASFEELQGHLARWMVAVADQRIHGTTHEKPTVRFERDERQALRPLPARPLAVRTRRLKRRVSTDCSLISTRFAIACRTAMSARPSRWSSRWSGSRFGCAGPASHDTCGTTNPPLPR